MPLYKSEEEACEFHDFVNLALIDGVHFPSSGVREGAVLAMHTANWLFHSSRAETHRLEEKKATKLLLESSQEKVKEYEGKIKDLLAEKEKTAVLAQAQANRLKQRDEQLDRAAKIRAELNRKVENLKLTQPLLSKTKLALEEEKAANSKLWRDMDDLKKTLQMMKEQKDLTAKEHAAAIKRIHEENAIREQTAHKELKRARNDVIRLRAERDGAVEVYRESSAFEEEILRARRQGYYKGLEMNVHTFSHYGALDLEVFRANRLEPTLRETAPVDEYAQQWAHLPEDEEEDDAEEVDEEIVMEESGPAEVALDVEPSTPVEEAPLITEVIAPSAEHTELPAAPEEGVAGIEPMPLAVILPLPTPASERLDLPDDQPKPLA